MVCGVLSVPMWGVLENWGRSLLREPMGQPHRGWMDEHHLTLYTPCPVTIDQSWLMVVQR